MSLWDDRWFLHVLLPPWSSEEEVRRYRGALFFAGDTGGDLFKFQGTHNQHGCHSHSAVTCYPIWLVVSGTLLCFLTEQWDWELTGRIAQMCVASLVFLNWINKIDAMAVVSLVLLLPTAQRSRLQLIRRTHWKQLTKHIFTHIRGRHISEVSVSGILYYDKGRLPWTAALQLGHNSPHRWCLQDMYLNSITHFTHLTLASSLKMISHTPHTDFCVEMCCLPGNR